MQISIIIVHYKVPHFLMQCLVSVFRAIEGLDAEVWVVDNASGEEGGLTAVKAAFPAVNWIENANNVGFAKANNQALAQAKGDWILFLNPDTLLGETSLQKLLHYGKAHPSCGAVGFKMIDGRGRYLPESKRGFPTIWRSFCKLSGITSLWPNRKWSAGYYLGHLSQDSAQRVEVLAGAAMAVRKKVLDSVGSFDEQFFMYGEDIDLSYSIDKAGWENHFLADVTIVHFKGESTKKGELQYVLLFYKAMLQFVQKHYQEKTGSGLLLLALRIAIGVRALIAIPEQWSKTKWQMLLDGGLAAILGWAWFQFWSTTVRPDVSYHWQQVYTGGAALIVGWLMLVYWWGRYDKPSPHWPKWWYGLVAGATLLLLYSLLPESLRFSRGMVAGFLLLLGLIGSWLPISKSSSSSVLSKEDHPLCWVWGDEKAARWLRNWLSQSGISLSLAEDSITHTGQLQELGGATVLVTAPYDAAIAAVASAHHIGKWGWFYPECPAILFSEGAATPATVLAQSTPRLATPFVQRQKRAFDLMACAVLFLLSPVYLKNGLRAFGKLWLNGGKVALGGYSWVGGSSTWKLPEYVRPGILFFNGKPCQKLGSKELPENKAWQDWYLDHYSLQIDLQLLIRFRKQLGQ